MFITLSILFGLLSMLAYGCANVFSRPLAQKLGTAPALFLRGLVIVTILAICSIPSYHSFNHYQEILLTLGLGLAGYLPLLAFTHGIKVSRIGVIAPIAGTSPLVSIILSALILKTGVHAIQWLAIMAVIGANVAMSVDLKNWRNSNIAQLSSGVPFALMATVGWGGFYFLLIYTTRWLGPWLSALLVETGVTIAAGIHVLASKQKPPMKQVRSLPVIANAILITVGTLAFTLGVRRYSLNIVITLSNSTAVVAALIGTYKFHEHLTTLEKTAASIMIVGIAVISFF